LQRWVGALELASAAGELETIMVAKPKRGGRRKHSATPAEEDRAAVPGITKPSPARQPTGTGPDARGGAAAPKQAAAPTPHRSAGSAAATRRARTPPPSAAGATEEPQRRLRGGLAAAGEQPREGALSRLKKLRMGGAAARDASPGGAATGRRGRTPPPAPQPASDDQPGLQGGIAAKMAEKLEQLRYLQDFFHNPVPFDLRDKPLPTSSEPEEVAKRIAEVEYQIHVLQALIQVLSEELKELNRALPPPQKTAAE
jgi:hypothetical protein